MIDNDKRVRRERCDLNEFVNMDNESKLSVEVFELIQCLLKYDHYQRLTAKEENDKIVEKDSRDQP